MRISDWSSDVCSSDLNLELSQPYEARDATIHRILQQVSQILAQGWRDAMGDKILDPALGLNQRIGAKALDRRGAGKDRAGAATLRNEATGKILIRCRRLGFPSDTFAQIPCAPPRKGAIAVDSAKVRKMLVPGLLERGIEE